MTLPLTVWLLSLVVTTPATSPVHSPRCVTDSAAHRTTNFARILMTSADSFHVSIRSGYRLQQLAPSEIEIVADSSTCTAGASAYVRHGEASLDAPPERVAVVRAGPYFFVEVITPPSPAPEAWEIALFTHQWKRVVSFGGGS